MMGLGGRIQRAAASPPTQSEIDYFPSGFGFGPTAFLMKSFDSPAREASLTALAQFFGVRFPF